MKQLAEKYEDYNPADLRNAERNCTIAQMHLKGFNYTEIAKNVNVNKRQITNILSDKNIKEIVINTVKGYILNCGIVAQKLLDHIDDNDPQVSLKAIAEYNKIIGISSAHAPVIIQNMYVDNSHTVISDSVLQILHGSGDQDDNQDSDIIDIDTD